MMEAQGIVRDGPTTAVDARPGRLEQAFGVAVLMFATQAPVELLQNAYFGGRHPEATASTNPVTMGLWLTLYVSALALSWPRRERFVETVLRSRAVLALLGLAVMSAFWSDAPAVTLKRAPALVGTSIIGWYFATRYTPADLARLLTRMLLAAGALSYVFALGLPYGTSQAGEQVIADENYIGSWNGIYTTKNALGQVMALAVVMCLLGASDARRRRPRFVIAAVAAVVLIVNARSATSLLLMAAFSACVPFLSALIRRHRYVIVALIAAILPVIGGVVTFILADPAAFFAALGRDATFTGRLPLWRGVIMYIGARPWLGYGHSAFWISESPGYRYILDAIGWTASYAHNGFMDQWLNTGAVGVGCLLWVLGSTARGALALGRRSGLVLDAWPAVYVAFLIAANLTEGGIVQQNSYMWMLLVACHGSVQMARARRHDAPNEAPDEAPDEVPDDVPDGARYHAPAGRPALGVTA